MDLDSINDKVPVSIVTRQVMDDVRELFTHMEVPVSDTELLTFMSIVLIRTFDDFLKHDKEEIVRSMLLAKSNDGILDKCAFEMRKRREEYDEENE